MTLIIALIFLVVSFDFSQSAVNDGASIHRRFTRSHDGVDYPDADNIKDGLDQQENRYGMPNCAHCAVAVSKDKQQSCVEACMKGFNLFRSSNNPNDRASGGQKPTSNYFNDNHRKWIPRVPCDHCVVYYWGNYLQDCLINCKNGGYEPVYL